MNELEVLIRARYPLIYVISWEEQRVLTTSEHCPQAQQERLRVVGHHRAGPAGHVHPIPEAHDTATQDPLVALDNVIEHVEPALYVFKDFHPFLNARTWP